MKRVLLLLISASGLLMSGLVLSDQQNDVYLCPFKETVVIKNAPPGTQILSLVGDALAVEQQGTSQFLIYNIKQPCRNGTVTAHIGLDNKNYTAITFHDGPWIFMDIKSITNHGSFKFAKWNPDYKRHYYELDFMSGLGMAG